MKTEQIEKKVVDIDVTPARERREIIQISGTHFLIGAVIIANAVIAAAIYREHNIEVFRATRVHNADFSEITRSLREAKNDVTKLEGVAKWADTAYARARPWTAQDEGLK